MIKKLKQWNMVTFAHHLLQHKTGLMLSMRALASAAVTAFFLVSGSYGLAANLPNFSQGDLPKSTRLLTFDEILSAPSAHKRSRIMSVDLKNRLTEKDKITDAVKKYFYTDQIAKEEIFSSLNIENFRVSYFKIIPASVGEIIYLELNQYHQQYQVESAKIRFVLRNFPQKNTQLVYCSTNIYKNLPLTESTPSIDISALEKKARQALGLHSEIKLKEKESSVKYLLGKWRWIYQASSKEKPGLYSIVDRTSGEVFVVDKRHFAYQITQPVNGIKGRIQGRGILFDPHSSELDILKLTDLAVMLSSGQSIYTDAYGDFTFPQTDTAVVSATLKGRWADVHSAISPTLYFEDWTEPGEFISVLFNPTDMEEDPTAQINGYWHTTFIHNYLQGHFGGALPEIDFPITVNVNREDGLTFYLNSVINFAKSNDSSPNKAFDTVIYHEYGHFVDDMAGGVPEHVQGNGLSEGWGDTIACFATKQPLVFEGLWGEGSSGRRCDNDYQFPPSGVDEMHALGQAWSGFAWHLRENLIAKYGERLGNEIAEELILPVIVGNPSDIPAAVVDTILRDDDDENLFNGTPNFNEIIGAAHRHALLVLTHDSSVASLDELDEDGYAHRLQQSSVTITGTADSANIGIPMQQYEMFYGIGDFPSEWIPIGSPSTTPVNSGPLGIWDFSGLPEGLYALRLLVTTVVPGYQFEHINYLILSDNDPPVQITTDPHFQQKPAISGDLVVWEDQRNGNNDIYFYDLTSGIETQITDEFAYQGTPDIDGDYIVWEDMRNGNRDVYLYNVVTQTEMAVTHDSSHQYAPKISGDTIVWHDYRNGRYNIYLYQISEGLIQQITNNPADQQNPNIDGNRIVWQDRRNGSNYDIYLYDISTGQEQQITSNPADQKNPVISGDLIAWYDKRDGIENIYVYNLTTHEEQKITNDNLTVEQQPSIHQGLIAWVQHDMVSYDFDIFTYEYATGQTRQITFDPYSLTEPSIFGNRIVWTDYHNGNYDIYLLEM
ncbi:MAG: hypothetical protein HQL27_01270 [Candidatus Omnitrophica bacterium]|nr:hypothetical protein [Candidatus Omnitrophota bacterium]